MKGSHHRSTLCQVVVAVCLAAPQLAGAQEQDRSRSGDAPTLAAAQLLFYNGRYDEASALTLVIRASEPRNVMSHELRSSALLFRLNNLLDPKIKDALKNCATCPAMIKDFLEEVRVGQELARATLATSPQDEEALFHIGKLNLNYLWLQLGPLKKKTGWDQYWEARRSLDAVLKQNPRHVRARVARAWIDYIVDTKMPWGTKWLLGGGEKKDALIAIREAEQVDAEFFVHAEASFALWDMLVRERNVPAATEVARGLARDFPENRAVAAFLEAQQPKPGR